MADSKPINWAYPFNTTEASVNPLQYLTSMAKANDGFYPTGENGLWHGGVHFDKGTAAVFDQSSVRCIADGEVIAYRIDETYPISEYTEAIPQIKRVPFSSGFVLVKHTLQPPQPSHEAAAASGKTPPTLTFYSLYMHLQNWASYQAKAELPRPEFWEAASHIVNTKDQGLNVRAAPNISGTELAVLNKGAQITVGSPENDFCKLLSIISGAAKPALAPDSEGKLPGYVSFKLLKAQHEPKAKDSVVVLPRGISIKAGDLIGHLGTYQNHNGAAQPLLHLEVFSCEDVPGFINQSQAWARSLPETEKPLLRVHKNASRLITHRDDINADNPPRQTDAGNRIGVDLIIPQALLDRLPAASKIIVRTAVAGSNTPHITHWWRLDGLFADEDGNPINGWLAEQELITTRHSPWEWPGFQCIEDTGKPLEKLAYTFNAKGLLSDEEKQNYRTQISKADGGPILAIARLYDIVDTDKDGVLTREEIRTALGKPWHAQVLGQLITKYESEWFWNESKWNELDPLLEEEPGIPNQTWEVEKQRIEKLSWWREIAGQHGIDGGGKVWHIYPLQAIGNFKTGRKFIFTLETMQKIYPRLKTERDGDLLEIADELNTHIFLYKLDTPLRRAHFFSQIMQETGPQLNIEEGFVYKAESLNQIFRYFRRNPDKARRHGYEIHPGIKADGTRMNQTDFEAIANAAYGGRADLGNGDYATGDGWRFRGRGLKQLTGRSNYGALTRWHDQLIKNWPEDNVDFVETPELLLTIKYAVRSAAHFWITNKLYELADNGIGSKTIDSITQVINKNTSSYPERRANFDTLWSSKILE